MTYEEFKTYCMGHLWKVGDSVVLSALDTIIATAEAELNRTFKIEDRTTIAELTSVSLTLTLPTDYRELRHLYSTSRGEMKYVIPAEYANHVAARGPRDNTFTVINKLIMLTTAQEGEAFQCWYYRNVPKFATLEEGGDNWLVDNYFDVYLYAVLKHTAPFLREDERLAMWNDLFTTAFGSAMTEDADRKFAGSPLKIKFSKGIR